MLRIITSVLLLPQIKNLHLFVYKNAFTIKAFLFDNLSLRANMMGKYFFSINGMKIYYQWNPWAYMHYASTEIAKNLNIPIESIEGKPEFIDVWKSIWEDGIAVLAIENSYMGNIHTNLYNFLKYDYKIIWEYFLEIRHCLGSKESYIADVKKVYSQVPALVQCYEYIKQKNMEPIEFSDTALSAKYVSESQEIGIWAIASEMACKMYGLNILDTNVQDQEGNTTRFAIIVPKESTILYKNKSNKVSILFEVRDVPASLYKCLWAFATNGINLTKIESMPSYKWKFEYLFWVDFEGNLQEISTKKALEELTFFTSFIKILGEY